MGEPPRKWNGWPTGQARGRPCHERKDFAMSESEMVVNLGLGVCVRQTLAPGVRNAFRCGMAATSGASPTPN